MKTQIPERLSALREAMKQQHISAYIIPTTDPHMSEYPAACWKYREWKRNWKAVVLTCIG